MSAPSAWRLDHEYVRVEVKVALGVEAMHRVFDDRDFLHELEPRVDRLAVLVDENHVGDPVAGEVARFVVHKMVEVRIALLRHALLVPVRIERAIRDPDHGHAIAIKVHQRLHRLDALRRPPQ
eukprot:Amastigsp_a511989_11.p3 type:complete len:123 gc:universal Amastigsp_a511989_11:585-217(-)